MVARTSTRNFQQLLTLSPGTSASVTNNTDLGRGDSIITVNGQRTTSNNVRINGIDANAIGTNGTPNIAAPATDSLQEFIVQISLYDASQGRNAGVNVEAVTRSGGSDYHGNAYYFFRNKALKFIPIRESVRGELRAEFFNLFNWTNFANPNSNIAVPATFGRITATSSGPRVIQFALKVSF